MLDTGGWVSGVVVHASGRLYGYGDTFGVYRSDDFGASWHYLLDGLAEDANTVRGLAVSTADADRVAFCDPTSVWISADGGRTWTRRLDDLVAVTWRPDLQRFRGSRPLVYHPVAAGELWLAASRNKQPGSLWRSTDDGATWSPVGGDTFAAEQALTVHILPQAPNEIWVGTGAIRDPYKQIGGLWCSIDGGATWRKVWDNGRARTKSNTPPQVHGIARNAARVSVVATNTGVWQITAGDWRDPKTYVATQRAFAGQSIPDVTVLADGTFWASGDATGAAPPEISADGSAWTDRPMTLTAAYVPEWSTAERIAAGERIAGRDMLVQDVRDPRRWLLTGSTSMLLSEDAGATWRYRPGGMAGVQSCRVDFDQVHPERAYLATCERGLFVINDGGLSGRTVQSSQRSFDGAHTFHQVLVSADGGTIIGAGIRHEVDRTVLIRSSDGGAHWTELAPRGLPESFEGITRAVMSSVDPRDFLVLLGSQLGHGGKYHDTGPGGGQPQSPGLYRTMDGGEHFEQVGGAAFEGVDTGMRSHPEYAFLERDGIDVNVRYLALRAANAPAARGLWRSRDGGTTWSLRSDPVPGQRLSAFGVDPSVEGRLWAGGASLRRSDDGGDSWRDVADFFAVASVSAHAGRIAVLGRRASDECDKIHASADDGVTWQEMTGPGQRMRWARNVAVDPWHGGRIWVGGSCSIAVIDPPTTLAPLLAGVPADGSAPAASAGAAAVAAFDRDTGTADLGAGASANITMIRYSAPRTGGGWFEGSLDGTSWTTLATVSALPATGLQTLAIGDAGFYRYLRYRPPPGATGTIEVGGLEFRGQRAVAPAEPAQALPVLSGLVGKALRYRLPASGNPVPRSTVVEGALPAGLALDAGTGVITGTPTVAGRARLVVEVANAAGRARLPLVVVVALGARLSVACDPIRVQLPDTTGSVPIAIANTGDAPLSWSVQTPGLAWLAVTPTEGTVPVGASATLRATIDTHGIASAQARKAVLALSSNDPTAPTLALDLALAVGVPPPPPVIAADQTVTAARGGMVSYPVRATNDPGRWALASGSLPRGLCLDAARGIISGTPGSEGVFQAAITATNGGGTSEARTVTLRITPPAPGTNYDFDVNQAHFEATFIQTSGWTWGRSVGVGGSGGLATDSNERSARLPDPVVAFATAGQAIALGVSFEARADAKTGTVGGDGLRIGLSRARAPFGKEGALQLAAGIARAASGPPASALTIETRNEGGALPTIDPEAIQLVDHHWYAVDVTVTYAGSSRFTIATTIADRGADGKAPPALLRSHVVTRTDLADLVGAPLFAGFQGRNADGMGGVRAFDDFHAQPVR